MDIFKSFIGVDFNIIAQLVNTLILFLFMKKLLFKPVSEMMAKRREEIERAFNDAQDSTLKADKLQKEYEDKLQQAREEARKIVSDASIRAQEKADEILSKAQDDAMKLREKAQSDISKERQSVMNELKNEISSIAILAASKIVEKDIDEAKHEQLIHNFIQEVGEAKWQN